MPSPRSSELTQSQSSTLGAHTLAEILSQPQCWADSLKRIESEGVLRKVGKQFGNSPEWIFIGCGSSYYIALAAAASWSMITGTRARAVPASEILLFPDLAFNGATEFVPVLISRSGQTSEVVRVAQVLNQKRIASLAISCAPNQKLERSATLSIVLSEADEQSPVMTRSFTSMLLSLQYLAATLAGGTGVLEGLRKLPPVAEKILEGLSIRVLEFISRSACADYVCLGQGPLYGLACESALKVMEMSRTYAQSFHTLEFRHGPKTIVSGETLVTFLISQANQDIEVDVLEEIKGLGGRTLVVTNHITRRARAAADLIIELDCDLPEPTYLAPFAFAGQLTGFHTALQKELDPDRPTNLSRVVFLGSDGERPEAAD